MNAKEQMRAIIHGLTTEDLLIQWDKTEAMSANAAETPIIRGAIMDELEERDPAAFERWIDNYDDTPRHYFAA